jgi:hypothetical protein
MTFSNHPFFTIPLRSIEYIRTALAFCMPPTPSINDTRTLDRTLSHHPCHLSISSLPSLDDPPSSLPVISSLSTLLPTFTSPHGSSLSNLSTTATLSSMLCALSVLDPALMSVCTLTTPRACSIECACPMTFMTSSHDPSVSPPWSHISATRKLSREIVAE